MNRQRLCCPAFADELVRCETLGFNRRAKIYALMLQPASEDICADEVVEMPAE